LGARDYDPVLGRFLSVDPVLNPASPQQVNGYSYADNNPVTASDPSGLCRADQCGSGVAYGDGSGRFTQGTDSPGDPPPVAVSAPGSSCAGRCDDAVTLGINFGTETVTETRPGAFIYAYSAAYARVKGQYGVDPLAGCHAFGSPECGPGTDVGVLWASVSMGQQLCEQPGIACTVNQAALQAQQASIAGMAAAPGPEGGVNGRAAAFAGADPAIGRVDAAAADEGANALSYSAKITKQMGTRGWTQDSISETVKNPAATHSVWDYTTGDKLPATAYVQRGGGYVVVNDSTHEIVQVSDLSNPNWKPVWNDPRFQR